jgi:hypothetical protein
VLIQDPATGNTALHMLASMTITKSTDLILAMEVHKAGNATITAIRNQENMTAFNVRENPTSLLTE